MDWTKPLGNYYGPIEDYEPLWTTMDHYEALENTRDHYQTIREPLGTIIDN